MLKSTEIISKKILNRVNKMDKVSRKGIFFAILAAVLYALNSPISKIILNYMQPTIMAGALYVGAGVGMGCIALIRRACKIKTEEKKLERSDFPYTVAMILLDIAAPVCLLLGLNSTSASTASLLNNFEIVATAIIALIIFKEKISRRLWFAIILITLSCALLSFENIEGLEFSFGSLLILLACLLWGFENNCTRRLSEKDPMQIVIVKGICSGVGAIITGSIVGERVNTIWAFFAALLIGFVAYGLSIFFYVYAQRFLGAARTGAYYAFAPFIATLLSLVIFREVPHFTYYIAFFLMAVGAWIAAKDS